MHWFYAKHYFLKFYHSIRLVHNICERDPYHYTTKQNYNICDLRKSSRNKETSFRNAKCGNQWDAKWIVDSSFSHRIGFSTQRRLNQSEKKPSQSKKDNHRIKPIFWQLGRTRVKIRIINGTTAGISLANNVKACQLKYLREPWQKYVGTHWT